MGTVVQGSQEDFEKALDKVNPDPTTHYNKKSSDDTSSVDNVNNEVKDCIGNLILGCRMAQEHGAFELEDAGLIANSIDYLIKSGFTK
jgi:hypothetical protein